MSSEQLENDYSIYDIFSMDSEDAYYTLMDELIKDDANIEKIKNVICSPFIDLNKFNNSNRTPLVLAILKDNVEIVDELLNNSQVDINLQDKWGWTPLMIAVRYSNKPKIIVKKLLGNPDIKINIQDKDGSTALHIASDIQKIDSLVELLNHPDIDINIENNEGKTAWDLASLEIKRNFPRLNSDTID
jgi:ankyrin repeat protein